MKIEIDKLLEERMEEILQGTAEIVAETSVGYFQDTFRHKAFDGSPELCSTASGLSWSRPGGSSSRPETRKWTMPGYTTKDSKVRLRFRPISGTRAGVIRAFGSTPEG